MTLLVEQLMIQTDPQHLSSPSPLWGISGLIASAGVLARLVWPIVRDILDRRDDRVVVTPSGTNGHSAVIAREEGRDAGRTEAILESLASSSGRTAGAIEKLSNLMADSSATMHRVEHSIAQQNEILEDLRDQALPVPRAARTRRRVT